MTKTELAQMQKVFPNGWEESDIPSFIRRRSENRTQNSLKQGEKEGRELFNGMMDEAGIDLKAARQEDDGYGFLGYSPFGKEDE